MSSLLRYRLSHIHRMKNRFLAVFLFSALYNTFVYLLQLNKNKFLYGNQ